MFKMKNLKLLIVAPASLLGKTIESCPKCIDFVRFILFQIQQCNSLRLMEPTLIDVF